MEAPVGLPAGRSYVSGGLGTSLQKTHPDKIGQSGKNHSVTGRNLYPPVQGTGLGMSISRNIVRMMGGDIKVESQLGVGSRFTATIYLKLQDAAEVRVDQLVNPDVLVPDDDELSLESCCGMLNDFGMKAEAVEKVGLHHRQQQDDFACIIDWKLPGMDGIAKTRAFISKPLFCSRLVKPSTPL
ncbi:MAG: ATP-binding protein [Clostridia bacterium]|nr:ATP-binding protein [Clostridia bacterium]